MLVSLAALAVPVAGAFLVPDSLSDYQALLWLLALVPAFLLSYYRAWRGVATSLAFGMAVLSVTYAVAQSLGRQIPSCSSSSLRCTSASLDDRLAGRALPS
jgi:hypothetical protein